jgi:hypothetical protein
VQGDICANDRESEVWGGNLQIFVNETQTIRGVFPSLLWHDLMPHRSVSSRFHLRAAAPIPSGCARHSGTVA